MARTAAEIQAEIDQLIADRAAIGVAQATTSGDQSTTFQRPGEIDARLARLQAELAALSGGSRTRFAGFRKGA